MVVVNWSKAWSFSTASDCVMLARHEVAAAVVHAAPAESDRNTPATPLLRHYRFLPSLQSNRHTYNHTPSIASVSNTVSYETNISLFELFVTNLLTIV